MRECAKLFKAFSEPNRLRILKMLEIRPLCVCEITAVLKLATATVSTHLAILRDVGLVTSEKEGKWVVYRIDNNTNICCSDDFITLFLKTSNDIPDVVKDRKTLVSVDRHSLCGNK